MEREIERWWIEDVDYLDWTTRGLGIGKRWGAISFSAKQAGIASGIEAALTLGRLSGVALKAKVSSGERIEAGTLLLQGEGEAQRLHKLWKVAQNTLEYMGGVATLTHQMVEALKSVNPNAELLTTRKHLPGSKHLMIEAILDGGAIPHRLGLFDSVLVFDQHRAFFDSPAELEAAFVAMKRKFVEKKIAIEVASLEEARRFAALGADILQCEKMELEELARCVELRREYPHLKLSATGGVKVENIKRIATSGVDFVVTSAPYHAVPLDVKVQITKKERA